MLLHIADVFYADEPQAAHNPSFSVDTYSQTATKKPAAAMAA